MCAGSDSEQGHAAMQPRRAPLLRSLGTACGAVVFTAAVAAQAHAIDLDAVYGGMAKGCTYDQEGNFRIVTAYVDERLSGPVLARPDGGKQLAPFLGKAKLRNAGEFYTLSIPVSGATLWGIPVSRLAPYRGTGSGVAGVSVIFPLPLHEVKLRLRRAGVQLVPHDHGWGDITPQLQATPDGQRTELVCDLSM